MVYNQGCPVPVQSQIGKLSRVSYFSTVYYTANEGHYTELSLKYLKQNEVELVICFLFVILNTGRGEHDPLSSFFTFSTSSYQFKHIMSQTGILGF